MNKIIFCPECREYVDYIVKKEKRKYTIREKNIILILLQPAVKIVEKNSIFQDYWIYK